MEMKCLNNGVEMPMLRFGAFQVTDLEVCRRSVPEAIRAIGVSNMEADRLDDLVNFNKVCPALNQIEAHLYCQRREEKKRLRKYGVAHQACAPLGQGLAEDPAKVEFAMTW